LAAQGREYSGEEYVLQKHEKALWIDQETYQENIHDSIINSILSLEDEEITEIFGIRCPTRILSEGERIKDDIIVEDFALTGSYRNGEMALGQVVSCDGKPPRGNIPGDFNQAQIFGETVSRYPDLDVEITGQYVIRAKNTPEQVRSINNRLEDDLEVFGGTEFHVDIYEISPYEKDVGEAMRTL